MTPLPNLQGLSPLERKWQLMGPKPRPRKSERRQPHKWWVLGGDWGKETDYSAYCVLEVTITFKLQYDKERERYLESPHIEFKVHAIDRLENMKGTRPDYNLGAQFFADFLVDMSKREGELLIFTPDDGGVGHAVADFWGPVFRERALKQLGRIPEYKLMPVHATGPKDEWEKKRGIFYVSREELVHTTIVAAEQNRFKVPRKMKNRELFWRELRDFERRVREQTGIERFFGDWKSGQHDDIVSAALYGTWIATALAHHNYPALYLDADDIGIVNAPEAPPPAGYTHITHSPMPPLPELDSRSRTQ